jgi:hypothetical protein
MEWPKGKKEKKLEALGKNHTYQSNWRMMPYSIRSWRRKNRAEDIHNSRPLHSDKENPPPLNSWVKIST